MRSSLEEAVMVLQRNYEAQIWSGELRTQVKSQANVTSPSDLVAYDYSFEDESDYQ